MRNHIPYERYAGRVFASGSYGTPTMWRPTKVQSLQIGFAIALALLYFLGIIDNHGIAFAAVAGVTVPAGTAAEKARALYDERKKFATWYEEQKNDEGVFAGNIDEFRKRNDALGDMNKAYEIALETETAESGNKAAMAALDAPTGRKIRGGDPTGEVGDPQQGKSLGEMFVESKEFLEFVEAGHPKGKESMAVNIDLDGLYGKGRGFKTVFDTASSYVLQNVRLPEPITPGAQGPTVASLMPEGRTSGNAILYMEETTTTSNAAETAESGTKPEAALAFTERTSTVRKIADSLPVTDESLEDIPFIESYIDGRLRFFIVQREDSQLLNGNGTPPNLRGILNTSGINTQATGSDPNQDAILKAIVAGQVASFFDADAVVLHPLNWQTMRLAKDDVGSYLFGPPNIAGADTVFGYRIVRTTAITQGTGLAGAFRACAQVFRRSDLSLSIGWINDQFVKNQRTILVEERLALVVFRPSGFTKITGLA